MPCAECNQRPLFNKKGHNESPHHGDRLVGGLVCLWAEEVGNNWAVACGVCRGTHEQHALNGISWRKDRLEPDGVEEPAQRNGMVLARN